MDANEYNTAKRSQKLIPDSDKKLEGVALSAQYLRLASMNLIIADQEGLAAKLDDFIDVVDRISNKNFN